MTQANGLPFLPDDVIGEIASHIDCNSVLEENSARESARRCCLVSHAFRHHFQPCLFRKVLIVERGSNSYEQQISQLLSAFESNPTLLGFVKELEYILHEDSWTKSNTPLLPLLMDTLKEITAFSLLARGLRRQWKSLHVSHREAICRICQRPTLRTLSFGLLFDWPANIVFNDRLKVSSLAIRDVSLSFCDADLTPLFDGMEESPLEMPFFASLETIVCTTGAGTDLKAAARWLYPAVKAASSSKALRSVEFVLYGNPSDGESLAFLQGRLLSLC